MLLQHFFIKHDIKPTTHAGVRQMFGLYFIKTGIIEKELGKFYFDIFDMRQTGDYEDFIDFSESDVLDLVPTAYRLILAIESLINEE
jgi:uncharacterized protein (UPF0332 family)